MPPKPNPPPRVFGIGLSRTGTESLTEALRILGWRKSVHWPLSLSEIADAEAATDVTVSCRFEALARVHPKAKFILTIREYLPWVRSILGHITEHQVQWVKQHCNEDQFHFAMDAERKVYGRELKYVVRQTRAKAEHELAVAYTDHGRKVRDFFRKQFSRLLVLDVCGGDGWGPLCKFLEVPIPNGEFPWRNRGL